MKCFTTTILAVFSSTAISGHFVGFSSGTTTGDVGLLGMNEACVATYGAGAKFCSSKDIVWSPTLSAQTGEAWVRPVYVNIETAHAENSIHRALEYSGQFDTPENLSCDSWRTSGSPLTGLVVTGNKFAFMTYSCHVPAYVACCSSSAAYRIAPN